MRQTCRVCNNFLHGFPMDDGTDVLPGNPLLRLENMPKSAQYLPDAMTVGGDKGITLELYQCSGCGLVQLANEPPVPYFREVIRASGLSAEMMDFRREQFRQFVKTYNLTGKNVIEIGAGKGEFIDLWRNVQVGGIEARGGYWHPTILRGYIDNNLYEICNLRFDAFYTLNYLEHIPTPNSLLSGIAHNLVDGAVGIVEVPNFNMILAEGKVTEICLDHLLYFTADTLRTTLQLNGFDVIEVTPIWHDYILSATVRKRNNLNVGYMLDNQLAFAKKVYDFILEHERVAIWGAGHQAFATMALCELSSVNIEYVVDSAPFKQGKFTPATHIPIVCPDTLKADPVQGIILICGGYNVEVRKIINDQYPDMTILEV